jgi:2-polyprenyl-3-methyl-5-hydroxy-6-metoxy-1,4-benzoquinol methylase
VGERSCEAIEAQRPAKALTTIQLDTWRASQAEEAHGRWPEIVCPKDGGRLTVRGNTAVCPLNHGWTSESGIARMVDPSRRYTDAFGLQWKTYRKTQLDSYTNTTLSLDRARRCLGGESWAQLHNPQPINVLEAGCGAGRFTEVLLAAGASVTSVDLSSAVDANQENFPQNARHRVLQADLLHLPFSPGQFDLVFCLGVIQHTPNPEETIRKLYEQVRPGGWLVIDHYAYSLSELTKLAFFYRLVLRRMPPNEGLKWTERLVDLFLPLHKAVRSMSILRALLTRISPVLAYYHCLPLTDELHREWALLDTHDALTDWYKHFRTKGQIKKALENVGATAIWCEYGGNGVEARCRRPLSSTPA